MQGNGLISRLSRYATTPLSEQMGLIGWAAFTVFILTVAFLWSRVLHHIEAE